MDSENKLCGMRENEVDYINILIESEAMFSEREGDNMATAMEMEVEMRRMFRGSWGGGGLCVCFLRWRVTVQYKDVSVQDEVFVYQNFRRGRMC